MIRVQVHTCVNDNIDKSYTCSYTARYDCVVAQKVGPKGQVVIPKKFRDELGIEPGDEVEVSLSKNGVLIQSVHTTKTLRGIFSGSGMLEMLIADRSKESG